MIFFRIHHSKLFSSDFRFLNFTKPSCFLSQDVSEFSYLRRLPYSLNSFLPGINQFHSANFSSETLRGVLLTSPYAPPAIPFSNLIIHFSRLSSSCSDNFLLHWMLLYLFAPLPDNFSVCCFRRQKMRKSSKFRGGQSSLSRLKICYGEDEFLTVAIHHRELRNRPSPLLGTLQLSFPSSSSFLSHLLLFPAFVPVPRVVIVKYNSKKFGIAIPFHLISRRCWSVLWTRVGIAGTCICHSIRTFMMAPLFDEFSSFIPPVYSILTPLRVCLVKMDISPKV